MTIPKLVQLSILLTSISCGSIKVADNGGNGGDGDGGGNATQPSITAVDPARGPLAGGNEVVLTGTNFSGDLIVVMNGREVTDVTSPSETTLSFNAPAGTNPDEPIDILVYGDSGFGTLNEAYTYNEVPTLTAILPAFGPISGGQQIEVHGSGFLNNNPDAPTVRIAGIAATNVTVIDDTTLTADSPMTSPDLVAESQDVVVETANGSSTLASAFVMVRPGLLLATRKLSPEVDEFGISFFDIPTGKIAQIIPLDTGVGRMDFVPGEGIIARLNRDGASGNVGPAMLSRIDLVDGSITDLGPAKDGTSSIGFRPLATIAGKLHGLSNGSRLGSVDLGSMAFTQVGTVVSGTPSQGCLAADGSNGAFQMDSGIGSLSRFNLQDGAFSAVAPLVGLPPGSWRCHGAVTRAGGVLFALFIDRTTFEAPGPGLIVTVNTNTGVVTTIANLPPGYGALMSGPDDVI